MAEVASRPGGVRSMRSAKGWSAGERPRWGGFSSAEWSGSFWRSARSRRRMGTPSRGLRRSSRDRSCALRTIRRQLDARYRGPGRPPTRCHRSDLHRRRRVVHATDAGPARDADCPGRQRDLLRDLPGTCYLSVPRPPLRPSGVGAHPPPAGARARAPHVSGDIGRRRRRLASHAALHPLRGRARGAQARGRPFDPGEGARPRPVACPLPHRSRWSSIGSPALGSMCPSVLNRPPADGTASQPRLSGQLWAIEVRTVHRRQLLVQRRALEPRGRDRACRRWRGGARKSGAEVSAPGRADPSQAFGHRCECLRRSRRSKAPRVNPIDNIRGPARRRERALRRCVRELTGTADTLATRSLECDDQEKPRAPFDALGSSGGRI